MPTKTRPTIVVALLSLLISLCANADAAVLTVGNLSKPTYPGQLLSFDLVVSDAADLTAAAFQATINVDTPGLNFLQTPSKAVTSDSDYWIYGNSAGIWVQQLDPYSVQISDSPDFPTTEALIDNDIMARFVFEWDGTQEIYTFTLDLDTTQSYFLLPDMATHQAIQFNSGQLPGGQDYFSINLIPEPATAVLLALGGIMLRRKS